MEDRTNIRLRLLSFLVIAYMLMAFTWWAVLLFAKNKDAFEAKRELLYERMKEQQMIQEEKDLYKLELYQLLERHYRRQEWMILGEAAVFVLSLIAGIWFINRGYHKEMVAATQRRNFLLSITHELKSPIASIRLVLETFLKRALERRQLEKLSHNALKDTERLHQLVENLLLSAKLESAYQPDYRDINLPELLDDLLHKTKDNFPNAHFEASLQTDIPHWHGDKMGITSVALNLLENAVKYSPEPARITMRLLYQKQPSGFLLQVSDEGSGISDGEKRKIFQKFYRSGNEDTRKTKGTGLGLYIVEQVVKAHGGKIKVGDNLPTGTTFEVFLPA